MVAGFDDRPYSSNNFTAVSSFSIVSFTKPNSRSWNTRVIIFTMSVSAWNARLPPDRPESLTTPQLRRSAKVMETLPTLSPVFSTISADVRDLGDR